MSPKPNSRRLDVAVAQAAAISRERAQALIMAGKVSVDGETMTKAGASVGEDARIDVRDDARFVSRGGVKLERALDDFGWTVDGLVCLDVGASTGGFTDCLLQRGAASVTAIDVGYGQIAWALRNDPRVKVIERCNFRLATPAKIGAPFDFACADVSFISLAKLARAFREALRQGARFVGLVKPQFEAGKDAVGRGGVVRDPAVHATAIGLAAHALNEAGLTPTRLTHSPLTGPAGNIEFLIGAIADDARDRTSDVLARLEAERVVAAAHEALAR